MKTPNEAEMHKMIIWLKKFALRLSQSTSAADQYLMLNIEDFLKRFDKRG